MRPLGNGYLAFCRSRMMVLAYAADSWTVARGGSTSRAPHRSRAWRNLQPRWGGVREVPELSDPPKRHPAPFGLRERCGGRPQHRGAVARRSTHP